MGREGGAGGGGGRRQLLPRGSISFTKGGGGGQGYAGSGAGVHTCTHGRVLCAHPW